MKMVSYKKKVLTKIILFFLPLLHSYTITIYGTTSGDRASINLYKEIWKKEKDSESPKKVNLGMSNEEFDAFKKRFHKLLQEQLSKDKYDTLLKEVEGKEIVLVLGTTGVGKSTFINRMLGYEFGWVEEDLNKATPSVKDKKTLK